MREGYEVIIMFDPTFSYNSLALHSENYLKAVLRQDIAYFDNLGAGEVTTRIQTDTRNVSLRRPASHNTHHQLQI